MINKTYIEALARLTTTLDNLDIDYGVEYHNFGKGFIVRFNGWDVAMHDYTKGAKTGLWESFGHPDDEGDVTGYMTINDIVNRFYMGFEELCMC